MGEKIIVLMMVPILLLCSCRDDEQPGSGAAGGEKMSIKITSSVFEDGALIPRWAPGSTGSYSACRQRQKNWRKTYLPTGHWPTAPNRALRISAEPATAVRARQAAPTGTFLRFMRSIRKLT